MKAFGTIVLTGALALAFAGCAEQKKPVVAPVEPAANTMPPAPVYPPVGSAPTGMTAAGLASPMMPPADLSAPAPVDLEPAATHTTPARATRVSATARPAVAAHATGHVSGKKYVVKKGDTLAKIAKAHYGSASHRNVNKIIAANASLKKNPNLIKVGQTLILP